MSDLPSRPATAVSGVSEWSDSASVTALSSQQASPTVSAATNNIKVVCRFRPQNAIEDRAGGTSIVSIDKESGVACFIESKEFTGTFTFDNVFDWSTTQENIFEKCGLPLIEQCFEGFNSTLFCYGQTGSGKTFTMMGADIDDNNTKGMTPRLVERVFSTIADAPSTLEFTVKVSFMEIYMERIRDLLHPEADNLPVHEDRQRGLYVKGLKEIYVGSVLEVLETIRVGDKNRSVASTNMNEQSSRSHSIFVMTITQKDLTTSNSKVGKLYLVDLAGSEKVGKTGATGQTLEEAKKINKSLAALGKVINSLTDGKSTHIPYRDSKLTRILQESLGGNSKTTLIINCSPSSYNDAETVSTLRFGMRAKNIKNTATANVELSAAELKVLLKKAASQLTVLQVYAKSLEAEVKRWRRGESVDPSDFVSAPTNVESIESLESLSGSTANLPETQKKLEKELPIPSDEVDEFLERENELLDELEEKEMKIKELLETVSALEKEMAQWAQDDLEKTKDLSSARKELSELKLKVEKIDFENKESELAMELLKETNREQENRISELQNQIESLKNAELKQTSITDKLGAVEKELSALIEKDPGGKEQEHNAKLMEEMIKSKEDEIERLMLELKEHNEKASATTSENTDVQQIQTLMEKQMADFEAIKNSLMFDLQNRCQKVVDLEVTLDKVLEENARLKRENRAELQDQKLTILERNLDQLTIVQKQLIDQNNSMKRNIDVAERKIINRNERISDLEHTLHELNSKMSSDRIRFEKELNSLRKNGGDHLIKSPSQVAASLSFGEGRIAKPLRGGNATESSPRRSPIATTSGWLANILRRQ